MNHFKTSFTILALLISVFFNIQAQGHSQTAIRFAIAGVTHGHSAFILGRKSAPDFELVGIYEPNRELALRYAKMYKFDPNFIYDNLGRMLDSVKPEAVLAFGSIYDHMSVVEACAPRGIIWQDRLYNCSK